jgi:hypothetical protein
MSPPGLMASGGMLYNEGGMNYGMIPGADGGMADTIGGVVSGGDQVSLSSGEFIIPADVVSMLGDGNSDAGADALHSLMERVRRMKTGSGEQAPPMDPRSVMPV